MMDEEVGAITIRYAPDVPGELMTVEDIKRAIEERLPGRDIFIGDGEQAGYVFVGDPSDKELTRYRLVIE